MMAKKISTINRRLSTIKKHILPWLFAKNPAPGSREEQMGREMDAIVRGIRRTVGAEQRVRGKKPLLIENIRAMCEVAAQATDDDGNPMINKRCRDVCLLLFLLHSAMRRNEVVRLLWSDLTIDRRGVVVQIRTSKSDRESRGQTIAFPRLDGPHCPVAALEAWRDRSGGAGAGESPVLRWISKKDEIQWRELIDQRIVAIIKYYAARVGLDAKCFCCSLCALWLCHKLQRSWRADQRDDEQN
jgi:integrase